MSFHSKPAFHIFQAKFANKEASVRNRSILLRKRGVVPRFNIIQAESDGAYTESLGIGLGHWTGCGGSWGGGKTKWIRGGYSWEVMQGRG